MEDVLNRSLCGAVDSGGPAREATHGDPGSEELWIEASRRGDVLAFNRLVLRWETPIYAMALRMLQSPDEAAEATQEVFLSAFKAIRRFKRHARFSSWLYRIATNQCLSRIRRRPREAHRLLHDVDASSAAAPDGPSSASAQEQELLRAERRRQVLRALRGLPPERRIVVELKIYQDQTFDQIASIVQTPVSTVKTRFYASLQELRKRLCGLGD